MLAFRIIGWIMMIGIPVMLAFMWASSGIPVSPEDWAACIAVHMMCLVYMAFGGLAAFYRD